MVIENECSAPGQPHNSQSRDELLSTFGPYEQTLFLGCSVLNFSASAGWNGQTSELTIDLAEDICGVPVNDDGTINGTPKKVWSLKDEIFPTPLSWIEADPGFTYPKIGSPAYFRVGNFEFSGLIQAWTEKKGSDGLPTFSVKLIDPRPILDHAKVILDTYQGTNLVAQTSGPPKHLHNLINVYAYLEENNSLALAVDDFSTGVGLGSPIQRIGGSYKTANGISWTLVKKALRDLIGGAIVNPAPNFSTGGIAYIQSQDLPRKSGKKAGVNYNEAAGGEIYIPSKEGVTKYILDLDEVPDPYTWDYRISGPTASISEMIDQVCSDAGVDYYVELLPTANSKGEKKIKELVIKIRTVARTNQPTLGTKGSGDIKDFITKNSVDAYPPGGGGLGIISNSFGRELRSDTNSAFIIGANARQYYEELSPNYIEAFWGYDADGDLISSDYNADLGGYAVNLDFTKINIALSHPVSIGLNQGKVSAYCCRYGWVYETQLRYALGDYDTFVNNILKGDGTTVLERYFITTLGRVRSDVRLRGNQRDGMVSIGWHPGVMDGLMTPGSPRTLSAISLHKWLQEYVAEFYGRQFLVSIPSVSYAVAGTTWAESSELAIKPIYTDEPSTEGGWPSTFANPNDLISIALSSSRGLAQPYLIEKPDVLGIANPSIASDFFKDEQGKVQPILKYQGSYSGLGVDRLSLDDYICVSGDTWANAWVKADMNEHWVTGNPRIDQSPESYHYVSALLTIPAAVINMDHVGSIAANYPINDFAPATTNPGDSMSSGLVDDAGSNLDGFGITVSPVGPVPLKPIAAGVPIKSNTRTYGPWVMMGANPGSVKCEVDDSLAPWEYGSIAHMNAAAVAKVQNTVTSLQVGERGEVTVPGYPTISLGSALASSSSSANYADRSLKTLNSSWPNGLNVPFSFVVGEAYPQYMNNPLASRTSVGSSISNISVTVGTNGVTTSYTVNTFTPVFGRFSKSNAERIKNLGLRKFGAERQMRATSSLRAMVRGSMRRAIGVANNIGKGPTSPRSPAVWFAGKLLEDKQRKVVLAPTHDTMSFYEEYDNTSIVTMDNFFRPVSVDGGGSSGILAGSGLTLPRVNLQGQTNTYDEYRIGGYAMGERVVFASGGAPGTGYIATTSVSATVSSFDAAVTYPPKAVVQVSSEYFRAFLDVPAGKTPVNSANSKYWEAIYGSSPAGGGGGWMSTTPTVAGRFIPSEWKVISNEKVAINAPTQTIAPPPPTLEYEGLPIRQKYLDYLGDPYQNSGLFDDIRATSSTSGHDIEGVARKSIPWLTGNQPSGNDSILSHLHGSAGNYANDYRFLAHRGPLMLHGWGYDVHGKPIPNASGDESSHLGDFSTSYSNLTDKFKENWLSNANDWPVAPVDLRFDRKRGVWTVPPAFRLYQVESINGAAAGETGIFTVLKSKHDLSDSTGSTVINPTIKAENWSEISISKTEKNVAYYDSPSSSYWLLNAGGGKVIPGVTVSGTPAGYNSEYRDFKDGCIYVWAMTKPSGHNPSIEYAPNARVSRNISVWDATTIYVTGDQVRYSGAGSLCPLRTYITLTGAPTGAVPTGTDYWSLSGCASSLQYINTGITTITTGVFDINTGWLPLAGETFVDTGCQLVWSHGMTTTPIQGHYVEGGAGNDILVWYDCDIMRGWTDL